MSHNDKDPTDGIPESIQELWGAPPLLQGEDSNQYWALVRQLEQCIKPRNEFEWLLLKDFVDSRWQLARWRRLKAGVMEAALVRFRAQRRANTEIKLIADTFRLDFGSTPSAERESRGDAAVQDEQLRRNASALARQADAEIEALDKPATDADYAAAAAEWLPEVQQLERLEQHAADGALDALKQLEWVRNGLAGILERAADEILEGEYEEVPVLRESREFA
jgi:hypothetical protein